MPLRIWTIHRPHDEGLTFATPLKSEIRFVQFNFSH